MKPTDPGLQATSDAEVARRALKSLAERRLTPTPETFAEAFFEMAGKAGAGRSAVGVIKELARDLTRQGRLTSQEAGQAVDAAHRHEWPSVRESIDRALSRRAGATGEGWPVLVLALLKMADAHHANWTRARKLDAVARVVDGAAEQPDLVLERLSRLVESWGPTLAHLPGGAMVSEPHAPGAEAPAPESTATVAVARSTSPSALPSPSHAARASASRAAREAGAGTAAGADQSEALAAARAQADAWRQVSLRCLRVLEQTCEGAPVRQKLQECSARAAGGGADAGQVAPGLTETLAAAEREIAEEHRIRDGLQRLLSMLCDNIGQLVPEETWLASQMEPLRALLAGRPRSAQLLEAEARISALIAQHVSVRRSLQDAKVALKEMLTTLLDRIGLMSSSADRFHGQVGAYQRELENAPDFGALSRIVQGLLSDTRTVRAEIDASRTELTEARRKVETYETRVRDLERELTQVTTLVQRDPLTHALNRRGLEESFRIEAARAQRYDAPLSLAMIDLDDFKSLNDSLGHVAGDRALVHFVTTVQAALRSTEQTARTGGEEFAVLFPATALAEAFAAVERLQRELARRPFQYEGRTRPLTFSAGTAQWRAGESLESLMKRADRALYSAKRQGKNRVVSSD